MYPNKHIMKILVFAFVILISVNQIGVAQTTGKLSGYVKDTDGNPLPGANVLIVGTTMGAATDLAGHYVVLNVRPGTFALRVNYIGYQAKVVENVRVHADVTTKIDVVLTTEILAGEEVVITAERPLVEFNQTSSVLTVGKEEINKLPVQNMAEVVNLQAGVVNGHFRGGRIGEVQYQVDGVTVNNPYDNKATLELDRSILEEVQVISGTFDAKYGQAMSGVVNAILKTGSDKVEWSGEIYGGDYYTADKSRYPHNQTMNSMAIQNYQLTLSGPTFVPQTTFFLSGRRYSNDGYLFGERRFMPTDSSYFGLTQDINPTGDGKIIPMQYYQEWSGQGKLTTKLTSNIQLSYQAILNRLQRNSYNHSFRINPEGIKTQNIFSITHGFQWTHNLFEKMFYKISLRQNYFDYSDYKYESEFDPRYLEAGDTYGESNYELGASVQGVDLGRFMQRTNAGILKADFTWQATRSDLIEAGIEAQLAKMSFGSPGYILKFFVDNTQILQPFDENDPTLKLLKLPGVNTYAPRQLSAYLQDRVEWGDLVVRAGTRLEYFDANSTIPSDLENPANSIAGAPQSRPQKITIKSALAPRLGFSFPLTVAASIYFSYGHFYQMPGLGNMYNNADYSILSDLQAGGISYGVMGNPDLKPEKTVQYEFGLKQAITSDIGFQLSFFYKDIRDLLGVEFITTYAAAEYPRLTNVDFGSVYGFTISLEQRQIGPISTTLDYTMQFARGNSSDPRETANRAAAKKDPRPRDIPFDWDQRHTLNATAVYYVPNNFTIGAIIRFGSGQPYTPQIGSGFGADLETNSGRKSSFILTDLRAEKFFTLGPANMSAFLRVYNLLNAHFVNGFVFATTGSPDYTRVPATEQASLIDPSRFYEPRRIELGISFRSK